MSKKLVYSIEIDIGDDESDFEIGKFFDQFKKYVHDQLGSTCWKYKCDIDFKYPTEYKEIFCDTCETIHTHISENGDDFKCLKCESDKIRDVIKGTQPY